MAINWKRYHLCRYPLHVWIVVSSDSLLLLVGNFFGEGGICYLLQFGLLSLAFQEVMCIVFGFQADYTAVFLFRLLMFVDNGFAAGMGL